MMKYFQSVMLFNKHILLTLLELIWENTPQTTQQVPCDFAILNDIILSNNITVRPLIQAAPQ